MRRPTPVLILFALPLIALLPLTVGCSRGGRPPSSPALSDAQPAKALPGAPAQPSPATPTRRITPAEAIGAPTRGGN